ncbi:MAG: hypothetical protein RLZZ444_1684 [Pseudomonadota bacterium]
MKTLSDDLAAHLSQDATTLCHAWKLTRTDGVVMGFTDHDRDLAFGGVTYLAASGFATSDREAENSLAVKGGEITGGFSADAIRPEEIAAGLYDGARVDLYRVNWQAPAQRLLLQHFEIGEVERSDGLFRAELRGLSHRLGQTRGRIYSSRCDAMLGDSRCGVDLSAGFRATGAVISVPAQGRIIVSGLDDEAQNRFRLGLLTFTSGVLAGRRFDIQSHRTVAGSVNLEFWLPPATLPEVGDTFSIVAGCDKSFDMCRSRFSNSLNFRGFPHMPGADFTYSYADGEIEHDGGPLYE